MDQLKPKPDRIGDYQRLAEKAERERKRAKRRKRLATPDERKAPSGA